MDVDKVTDNIPNTPVLWACFVLSVGLQTCVKLRFMRLVTITAQGPNFRYIFFPGEAIVCDVLHKDACLSFCSYLVNP